MPNDDILERLFRTDLDRAVALPDPERWTRSHPVMEQTRWRTVVLAIPVVVIALAGALLLGSALNNIRSLRESSPSPAAGAPLSRPAPDPRFAWFVDSGGNQAFIVIEGDVAPRVRIEQRGPRAVSPDGRSVAYWLTGPNDALPHELRIVDVHSGAERVVATLTDRRGGQAGWLVWSTDGSGLAFTVNDRDSAFGGPRGPLPPHESIVRLLSIADGRTIDTIRTAGTWLRPIVWDRSSGLVAAVDTTSAGLTTRSYVHDLASGTTREYAFAHPLESGSVRTDETGELALGAEGGCDGQTCRTVGIWPVASPDRLVRRAVADASIEQATFRPGTREIWILVVAQGAGQVESWGEKGELAAQVRYRLPGKGSGGAGFTFRADGSALLVVSGGLNQRSAWLVDAANGSDATVPWESLWQPEGSVRP